MAYFPFFIELKNKKCCVIGGGMVAYRKLEALLEFEADITVIATDFCEDILKLGEKLQLIRKAYEEKDIEDAFFVIAATDDSEVNSSISKACRELNVLVNVVDELENCSFLFPAYIKRGDISIGVTTSGKSPVLAGIVKKAIQDSLPDFYAALADTLGKYREYVKEKVTSGEVRAKIFKELALLGIEKEGHLTKDDVNTVIQEQENDKKKIR